MEFYVRWLPVTDPAPFQYNCRAIPAYNQAFSLFTQGKGSAVCRGGDMRMRRLGYWGEREIWWIMLIAKGTLRPLAGLDK
jgi:hypothetical protein